MMSSQINYQSLFEDDDEIPVPVQMMQQGLLTNNNNNNIPPFPANLTLPPLLGYNHHHLHQSLKPITTIAPPPSYQAANVSETLLPTSVQKSQQDLITSTFGGGGSQQLLFSLNRSRSGALNSSWAWGEVGDCRSRLKGKRSELGDGDDNNVGVVSSCGIKMKKMKVGRRKVREPRFCFKTMSDVDVLDDGYKWRKYGQKVVKNTHHPRSYYRCTQDNCRVKKRVERLAEDPRMVITTYEGRHAHSPSNELEDSQNSSELCDFLW